MFKLRRISVVNAAYHRHVHRLAHIWYVYGTYMVRRSHSRAVITRNTDEPDSDLCIILCISAAISGVSCNFWRIILGSVPFLGHS